MQENVFWKSLAHSLTSLRVHCHLNYFLMLSFFHTSSKWRLPYQESHKRRGPACSTHGQQSATSGWVRGRYRYLLLLRKSRCCSAGRDRDLGQAEDRSTTNCGESFCLVICLSIVWLFFFPYRSNNRIGLLSECSKLTCFAKEEATWFWCTCGAESVLEKGKTGRGRRVQAQKTKKKTASIHEFKSRRVRVRKPKLHRRNARSTHQRMLWSDTRWILLCSTATSPTGLSEGFLLG